MTDDLAPAGSPSVVRDLETHLATFAMRSGDSIGREQPEEEHPYRGAFQRDRDRILHASAFRRLSDKTQVFTGSMGDYHRTRLTHTMEVASIARTIGRSLRLNEDLIEALALLHDIGHPPFGHAGEDTLDECLDREGGFSHNHYALTLVRELEQPYPHHPGLNLTIEVLDSQRDRASKDGTRRRPLLEAQVVDAADSVAYDAHDVDDAVERGLLELPELLEVQLVSNCHQRVTDRFGPLQGAMLRRTLVHELIDYQVGDIIRTSHGLLITADFADPQQARDAPPTIRSRDHLRQQKRELEQFLFERVYRHPTLTRLRTRLQQQLRRLFQQYCDRPAELPDKFRARIDQVGLRRAVGDYLGGMTDRYCLRQFDQLR